MATKQFMEQMTNMYRYCDEPIQHLLGELALVNTFGDDETWGPWEAFRVMGNSKYPTEYRWKTQHIAVRGVEVERPVITAYRHGRQVRMVGGNRAICGSRSRAPLGMYRWLLLLCRAKMTTGALNWLSGYRDGALVTPSRTEMVVSDDYGMKVHFE